MSGYQYVPGEGWELIHRDRPWTTNAERKWSPYQRAAVVKEWRNAFHMLAWAEKLPRPIKSPVVISAVPILRDHRGQDVGACYPAVKAAIDGLVDAGVLDDDTPHYVASIVFITPELGQKIDALALRIETL